MPPTDYIFACWSDGNQSNPRQVAPSSDVALYAKYKLHMISNHAFDLFVSNSATSPNSQRKIDWVQSQAGVSYPNTGLYQAVYESGGGVWFIQSSDMGTTWTPEILVSEGYGSAVNPCIASDTSGAYITYFDFDEIQIKKYRNGLWTAFFVSIGMVSSVIPSLVIEVTGQDNVIFCVWETYNGKLGYYIVMDGTTYQGVTPNTGSNPVKPSLAHYPGSSSYQIAWREGQNIFYQEVIIDPFTQNILFMGKEQVNQTYLATTTCAPSITVSNWAYGNNTYNAVVAYETDLGTNQRFTIVRRREFNWWGPEQFLMPQNPPPVSGDDYWAPSISHLDIQQPYPLLSGVRVACNSKRYSNINRPHYFRLDNGAWWDDEQGSLPQTLHPSTVAFPPVPYGREIIPVPEPSQCSSCYAIVTAVDGLNRSTPLERSRELLIMRDTTHVRLLLGAITYGNGNQETKLDWNRGYDTLVVGFTATVEEEIRTKSFNVQNGMHLKYTAKDAKRGNNVLPNGMYLKLQLVKESNGQVLATFGQLHPHSLAPGRRSANLTHVLNQYVGEDVFFRLSLDGVDTTVQLGVIDYYTLPGQQLPKFSDEGNSGIIAVPNQYLLSQNYPNPFNPSTEISYSIPEGGVIKLSVIDALGREVSTLINEYKDPGIYSVMFNGEKYPSGVYYYRLSAGGNVLTRKMSLIK